MRLAKLIFPLAFGVIFTLVILGTFKVFYIRAQTAGDHAIQTDIIYVHGVCRFRISRTKRGIKLRETFRALELEKGDPNDRKRKYRKENS